MTALVLPPTTEGVPAARRFVRDLVSDSETSADVDTVTLLVSEVVTNALLHGRPPRTVRVEVGPEVVRVEVADGSAVLPRLHGFSATAATGRGLRLLNSLALRWGADLVTGQGKVVWFEVGPGEADAWEATAEDWLSELAGGDA